MLVKEEEKKEININQTNARSVASQWGTGARAPSLDFQIWEQTIHVLCSLRD